jgi:tight adherence protein B
VHFALFALYAVTGLLALEGASALLRARRDPARVRKRLQAIAQRVAQLDAKDASILRQRTNLRLPSLVGLERLLYQAGGPMTAHRFVALSAVLALGGFLTAFLLTHHASRSLPALLPGLLPWLGVRRAAAARTRDFEAQLPEGLELMTRCLRTGHALGAAFQMVGDEFPDPIGTEFGLVAEEIRLGLGIRDALDNLAGRVDNPDLPYFSTAVLIQRQTGGNLAELLDKLGTLLRERIQFHGRVRALTAQGRMAAIFLALWLPFIVGLTWVVSPGYLQPLIDTNWGNGVLAGAFGVDVLAYYISLRISDVQA